MNKLDKFFKRIEAANKAYYNDQDTLSVACGSCGADPGSPCTINVQDTREVVDWFHASRQLAGKSRAS